jgi:hypothetical protein
MEDSEMDNVLVRVFGVIAICCWGAFTQYCNSQLHDVGQPNRGDGVGHG